MARATYSELPKVYFGGKVVPLDVEEMLKNFMFMNVVTGFFAAATILMMLVEGFNWYFTAAVVGALILWLLGRLMGLKFIKLRAIAAVMNELQLDIPDDVDVRPLPSETKARLQAISGDPEVLAREVQTLADDLRLPWTLRLRDTLDAVQDWLLSDRVQELVTKIRKMNEELARLKPVSYSSVYKK